MGKKIIFRQLRNKASNLNADLFKDFFSLMRVNVCTVGLNIKEMWFFPRMSKKYSTKRRTFLTTYWHQCTIFSYSLYIAPKRFWLKFFVTPAYFCIHTEVSIQFLVQTVHWSFTSRFPWSKIQMATTIDTTWMNSFFKYDVHILLYKL